MLKKENRIWLHLLLVLVVVIMYFFRFYAVNGTEEFRQLFGMPKLLYIFSFNTTFWITYMIQYNWACSRFLHEGQWLSFGLATLVSILAFAVIRYVLEEVIIYNLLDHHNYLEDSRSLWYYTFDNSYFALHSIFYSSGLFLILQYIDSRERLHTLQLESKKAELSVLRGQLEPHFLFNSLNSFYNELVDTHPDTAIDLHRLSELLRYVTYEADQDVMPLAKELKFLEHYIALQRRRFLDELSLNFAITGEAGDQRIPSWVLIHFVENVFKHGVINDKHAPAIIEVKIGKEELRMHTFNAILSTDNYTENGIGSVNLKRRLDLFYLGNHELSETAIGRHFESKLRIPYLTGDRRT